MGRKAREFWRNLALVSLNFYFNGLERYKRSVMCYVGIIIILRGKKII